MTVAAGRWPVQVIRRGCDPSVVHNAWVYEPGNVVEGLVKCFLPGGRGLYASEMRACPAGTDVTCMACIATPRFLE